MMKMKNFSHAKDNISVLGHGTWGMGGMWGPREDRDAINSLLLSLELGINFFDTALVYGMGHSESLISSALRESKNRHVFIASKVPPLNHQWPARESNISKVFPAEHIMTQTETSLRNLRRDYLDLQQLHVWKDEWLENSDWMNAVHQLKKQGKIRFFGVSLNDHDPKSGLKIVESGLIDSVQVIYNIFDQSPEDELFPLCQKHNVSVIARVPFDEGSLTGSLEHNTTFHSKDWRKHYFTPERLPEVCNRVEKLKALLNDECESLSELALRFCLSHDAVTSVIPGMRSLEHVRQNVAQCIKPRLSSELREKIKTHRWIRNFYPSHG